MLNPPVVSRHCIDDRTVRLVVDVWKSDVDTAVEVKNAMMHEEGTTVPNGTYLRGMVEALSNNGIGAYILRKRGFFRNWDFNGIQARADVTLPSWVN